MHALVLAAGNGKRFQPALGLPKCLLKFGEKSLLARHIDNLNRIGIETVTIVMGFQAEQVEDEIRSLRANVPIALRYNPNFEQGSLGSLCQAADCLRRGDSLVTNGDLLYDFEILQRIAETPLPNVLLIDSRFQDSGEEYYVWGENGIVRAFDHPIEQAHIVGEGVGITKCSVEAGTLWADAAQKLAGMNPLAEYQTALEFILPQIELPYLDIHDCAWTDVDDWNDLEYATRVIYPVLEKKGQA